MGEKVVREGEGEGKETWGKGGEGKRVWGREGEMGREGVCEGRGREEEKKWTGKGA